MKRGLLLVLFLTLSLAGGAQAGGFNLAWDQCWPEGGVASKCFACDTNSGFHALVGSFALDEPLADFTALSAIVDGQTVSGDVPPWWQMFNPGSCRSAALSVSFDFLESPNTSCVDSWQGLATGGIAAYQTALFRPPAPINAPAPNRLRIKLSGLLTDPVTVQEGVEHYAFRLHIRNLKTTGTGACAGCGVGLCLVLQEMRFNCAGDPSNWRGLWWALENAGVGWQSADYWGYEWPSCEAHPHCPVAARNQTWGALKALYR